MVEGRGSAVAIFTRPASWIETADPAPRILIVWNAGSDRDRANAYIAVIDVPAFLSAFVVAAAGEDGHGTIKARADLRVESTYRLGLQMGRPPSIQTLNGESDRLGTPEPLV